MKAGWTTADIPVRGHPAVCAIPPAALDAVAAARLWEISTELTGVGYELLRSRL